MLYIFLALAIGITIGYAIHQRQHALLSQSGPSLFSRAMWLTVDAANGFAEWDLDRLSIQVSSRQAILYSLEPDFDGSYEAYIEAIHPNHCDRFEQIIQSAITHRAEFELDFCIDSFDGPQRWLRSKGRVLTEDGQPVKLIEVTQDITRLKNLQEAHRRQELKWRTLLSNQVELVVVLDHNLCIAYVNSTIETLSGYSPPELLGQPFFTVVHAHDYVKVTQILNCLQSTTAKTYINFRLKTLDRLSPWIWVEAVAQNESVTVGGIVLRCHRVSPDGVSTLEVERSRH